jgi:pyrimidine deaminase RibD-like protein
MGRRLNADDFMRVALDEGLLALPACLPNPPVGCVLVRHGEIIARGHTQEPGKDHAEAMALRRVRGDLSDVTAYVSLEPCSFHGRTPSCARALVDRRIGRVVVALLDPDVRNDGAGIQMLRDAGVEVTVGVLGREALQNLAPYLALAANQRPERSRLG